jgi:hypothetical protein
MTSKTQQKLWETVPFGVLHWVDQRVRTRVAFKSFQDQVEETIDAEHIPPVEGKVIEYLYERALDARAELVWVPILQRIRKSSSWKSHQTGMERTIRAARQLEECAKQIDHRFLLPRVNRTVSHIGTVCSRLTNTLAEIQSWNKRMELISRLNNKNEVLRSVRRAMNRTLKKYCPALSQKERACLVRVAVEAGKLKSEETIDAIEKVLGRDPWKTKKTKKPHSKSSYPPHINHQTS